MPVRIEAPTVQPLPGGLLPAAEVRDLPEHAEFDGAHVLEEDCGTATILPGAICGMATFQVSAVGGDVTVSVEHAPAGLYTFTASWDADTDPESTKTAFGPDPSVVFEDVPNSSTVTVKVTSVTGVSHEETFTLSGTGALATPVSEVVGTKLFAQVGLAEGDSFTVYKGVECHYLGEELVSWAERALEIGENRAVEEGVLRSSLAVASTVDLTPTPGTAVSITQAVAIFERYAALNYGGTPVIHAARSTTVWALDQGAFSSKDPEIRTKQGIPVANGAGYESNLGPNGLPAAAGKAWLYMTGPITLLKGSVSAGQADAVEHNRRVALAERTWLPLVSCFAVAVLVNLEEA